MRKILIILIATSILIGGAVGIVIAEENMITNDINNTINDTSDGNNTINDTNDNDNTEVDNKFDPDSFSDDEIITIDSWSPKNTTEIGENTSELVHSQVNVTGKEYKEILKNIDDE